MMLLTPFDDVDEPRLHCRAGRRWGPLVAYRLGATAGRHTAEFPGEHHLVFYETGEVATDCACDTLRRTQNVAAGMFDLVPAGVEGAWEHSGPVEFVSIRFAPGLLSSTAEALAIRGAVDLRPQLGMRDPVIEPVVRALSAEIETPTPRARIYADSLVSALASRLLQRFKAAGAPRRRNLSKPQLRRLTAFIDENLAEDLTLERIASVAQISVPHLTAMFRRTTGQSVHRYVMERRVHRARMLLLDRRASVTAIAQECGFTHQSHLARWTRRVFGVTPAQIREP